MSRRPQSWGLTTSIRRGDYSGIVWFIEQHPWIADKQEIDELLRQASVHMTAGESDLAETCVHHALALRKWHHRRLQEARKYFESLAEGGETTREFNRDVAKTLAALHQKYGQTATGIIQSQTPVSRESDGGLYYTDSQGNRVRPTSNRHNPDPSRTLSDPGTDDRLCYTDSQENRVRPAGNRPHPPSRTFSDPATDDRNIREHGRTLLRYDPEPSIRHRQESPNSTSRCRPQGEPELPLKSYFLPTEGINYDVIQRDITRHLGATASVKHGVHKDGRLGYFIKANKKPTVEIIGDLKLASTRYENDRRSSGGMRPPISRQDSARTFNEEYRYDTFDVESGMQRMRIRDDDARYDLGQGPSRPTAISRHNQEQSRQRNMPGHNLLSSRPLVDRLTEFETATSFELKTKLQISRGEKSRPVKASLDTGADITCISERFMNSLPGAENAQRKPVYIEPHTVDDRLVNTSERCTIYIAWEGTGFKELVVYIFSHLPGADLLLSGDFIKENGLLAAGSESVEYFSRDLIPGVPVAVCQVSVRGPKVRPLRQDPGIDPQITPSAKPPRTDPPAQPPPRTTPGMRKPPQSHR